MFGHAMIMIASHNTSGGSGSSSVSVGSSLWACGTGGSLGQQGNFKSYSSPVQIPGSWLSAINNNNTFGIQANNTLWGCGYNSYGALAQGNISNYSMVQIPGSWIYCAGSQGSLIAISNINTLWVCGHSWFLATTWNI